MIEREKEKCIKILIESTRKRSLIISLNYLNMSYLQMLKCTPIFFQHEPISYLSLTRTSQSMLYKVTGVVNKRLWS